MMKVKPLLLTASVSLLLLVSTAAAQTTAFTYQGKLTDSGNLANGQYDFQFKLFDTQTVGTGTQIGALVAVPNVPVTNGTFTAQLDFGVCPTCFDGSARFLEIAVRPSGGGSFTTLTPRQQITATPYALKSQNATSADGLSVACVNCVTSSQIQSVNGSAVTGQIPVASVPSGSANYIQNQAAASQTGDFNINGNGTLGGTLSANTISASTQFNLGNSRVLSTAGVSNLFAGISAGASNTSGSHNAFVGVASGVSNTTGGNNAFFGTFAGSLNTTGNLNTFIGRDANFDISNPTGNNNTLLGALTRVTSGFSNATAIGAFAQVSQSNSLVLGGITGVNGGTSVNVGIGTTAPTERLHVNGNGLFTGNLTVNGTLSATLPAGSANYIQNTSSPQAASNFNISGTGTANILNATTQFNFGNSRVLSAAGSNNLFAGIGAGTSGHDNAFFGSLAGQANTTGFGNAFFGASTGVNNTDGRDNAFFGTRAGEFNTTGHDNAFFGVDTGISNTTGTQNAFFGRSAGGRNTTGVSNTFIGQSANFDVTNPTGNLNTLLGALTTVHSGVSNGTAVGANASVTQSNSLVLGGITGVTGGTDTTVGIGTTAPGALLDVQRDGGSIPETARFTTYGTSNEILSRASGGTRAAPTATPSGRVLLQLGATGHDGTDFVVNPKASILMTASEGWTTTAQGTHMRFNTTASGTTTPLTRLFIKDDGNVGISTTSPQDRLHVAGDIRVGTTSSGLGCVKDDNGTVIAGSCSSDARLKHSITPFPHLLDKLVQLQPVQFYWRADEFKDRHFGVKPSFGLIAQEVEKVLPELVSEDEQGYKAVNYSKLPLLSLQAIKELKQENDQLKEQNAAIKQENQTIRQQQQFLQAQFQALKQVVCKSSPTADLCKP